MKNEHKHAHEKQKVVSKCRKGSSCLEE